MLAVRALRELALPQRAARHDAVDDRRRDRQRDVARSHRGGGARAEQRRPRARALAARRRGEDEPQRLRRVRADGARRVGACRPRSGQGRERHPRARAPDPRDRRAAGSRAAASRVNVGVSSGGSRTNVVADDARAQSSTCGCRRWRTPARIEQRCARLRPSTATDRARGRRAARPAAARTHGRRRAPVRAGAGGGARARTGPRGRRRRAAGPTGISPPRSVFQH